MSPVPLLNESFDVLDGDETRWDLDFDSIAGGGNESGVNPLRPFQSFLDNPARSLNMRTDLSPDNSHTQTLARQSNLRPTALANSSDTMSLPGTTTDSLNSFLSLFLLQNDATISIKLVNQIEHNKVTLQDLIRLGLGVLESGFSQAVGSEDSEDSAQSQAKYNLKTKNHIRAGTGKRAIYLEAKANQSRSDSQSASWHDPTYSCLILISLPQQRRYARPNASYNFRRCRIAIFSWSSFQPSRRVAKERV